jgi:hypothetical protein
VAALPGHVSNHVHCPRAPVSACFGRNPGFGVERVLTGVRWPKIDGFSQFSIRVVSTRSALHPTADEYRVDEKGAMRQ